ncbi:rifin PIR protein, putative [Plasmodium reichenowi]|uniref:Rifin PIR protein, putative n=1 Tax=Plasmodium reichenowi TaxID=5854 RepID=A0A2P9DT61_PLARE|nr:rifin PIR protein, putative [Plasmodium reichenowi]
MKVHYINILMFAVPLNILAHNKNKPQTTSRHTPTTRLLCECEFYTPANYDNDPQMKAVMENFNKQTQQRFQDYDDRMKTTRQKCKERCDKEIQKIILKDKLEKQMAQHLTTLDTKINTDDIPTCICEKSMADKVEKTCLKGTKNLGGIVAPSSGVLGGIAEGALYVWKPEALAAAIKAALEVNTAKIAATANSAGLQAGIDAVIEGIIRVFDVTTLGNKALKSFITANNYTDSPRITSYIHSQYQTTCLTLGSENKALCFLVDNVTSSPGKPVSATNVIGANVRKIVAGAEKAAKAEAAATEAAENAAIEAAQEKAMEAASTQLYNAIGYSVLAILIIVLIMVIIYLILRYRRKKKMKKKLQYIKLLEE